MKGLSGLLLLCVAFAQAQTDAEAFQTSVQELRQSIGQWSAETRFLNPDGSVARSHQGTYNFEWVVEDRVISGRSTIPDLEMTSGILFYVSEAEKKVEMAAVGKDGKLWIMTGPLGGNVRTSQPYKTAGGGSGQLRFTRFNVTKDSFESKMAYSGDGGKTWQPANHQLFRRKK